MRQLIFGVVLVCSANAAFTQTVSVLGSGNNTCEDWTRHRAERTLAAVTSSERSAHWVVGYLRGAFDHMSASRHDPPADVDMNAIRIWLDNYCRKRPLDSIYLAASELSGELINRSNQ
jgi:hypothetical protein